MYRRLGRTGLGVSPVALGTMGFGPPTQLEDADRLVRTAIDLGVNLIDTANCYDGIHRTEHVDGHSEQMLGKILPGSLRDSVILLSKIGVPLRPGPQDRGLSATHILRELDASLSRLQTDCLDILLLHWPDSFAHPEEVLRAVQTAVQMGKVRYFGVSNHQGWEVCEYLWIGDRRGWPMVSVNELPLSMLDRRFENDLPFYVRQEVGVLAYQPLCGGLLSDRHWKESDAPEVSGEDSIAGWSNEPDAPQKETLTQLGQLAESQQLSLSQMALGWALAQPAVASVVLGARSTSHLESAVEAAAWSPSSEISAEIDRIAPGPRRPIPRFER